ncbi:MAG TPA: Gfo/Idh/MocA family oxidoreductase [Caulobacteraceae bacterium]|jgi:UDP-N-acetylglucosamine 3-dehydrogenase|nr:Gfo/Idh/MocA family oxidoreductase [Caulobacteraceae bacterium]
MQPIRIGILGAGAMGAEHAYCYGLIDGAEVAGVFSRDLARAGKLAGESGARATADAPSLIDDPAVDAIDVCVPSASHAAVVVRALEQGKHVFCETPLTLDPAEGRRMRDAARHAGRLLQVGLLTRSIGACGLVRQAVETGEHGRLLSLTTHRLGSYLRAGAPDHKDHYSDPSTELMTFDFDFAGWLMGPPKRVVASAVSTPQGLGEISALLDYDDGRSATVLASGLMPATYPFSVGFRALFETALIVSEAVFSEAGPPKAALNVYPQTGEPWRPDTPAANPYQLELERFVACIRGTADPALLDVDNALAALTLSIATQTSLSERRPVELG